MKKRHLLLGIVVIIIPLITTFVIAQTFGYKKRRPKPNEFGDVLMNNFSEKENIAPVVFKHWLHRAKYSCRLCHVDIGFAMRAEETKVTEKDNEMGLYCGSCHNGKIAFGPKGNKKNNCDKCHSHGKKVVFKNDFYKFRSKMPRERFGNGIDWLKAEEKKLIKLQDYLEGVSIKRKKLQQQKEVNIDAQVATMPDIIFSHPKHAKWSGCELCHPEVFSVKRGSKPYSMEEIFNGKYCGLCHGPVAFPNLDCQRCHTKEV